MNSPFEKGLCAPLPSMEPVLVLTLSYSNTGTLKNIFALAAVLPQKSSNITVPLHCFQLEKTLICEDKSR